MKTVNSVLFGLSLTDNSYIARKTMSYNPLWFCILGIFYLFSQTNRQSHWCAQQVMKCE